MGAEGGGVVSPKESAFRQAGQGWAGSTAHRTGRSVSTVAFRDQEHHFSCWELLGRGDLPLALGFQFPNSLGKIPGKGLRAEQGE